MAKKRKTLPKNFKELMEAKDIEALKAVYDTCEISAYGGYDKESALSFYGVPEELVRWLVAQGADINQAGVTYKRTPLHSHAMLRGGNIDLLLELGADVAARDKYGDTPLHMAAGSGFSPGMVKALLDHGADPLAEDNMGGTPLARALARANNTDIEGLADVAALLLEAGTPVTPEMKESVTRIGKEFEFHRENFAEEYLEATDAALARLYQLFDVEPVPRRYMHDGKTPILVPEGEPLRKHQALWELLIPSSGAAKTVQGEVIRISGKVQSEIHRNGGGNWDADFRKMLDALLVHLASGIPLSPDTMEEAADLVRVIRPRGDGDDESTRLCELAVLWVAANPTPVALEKPAYRR